MENNGLINKLKKQHIDVYMEYWDFLFTEIIKSPIEQIFILTLMKNDMFQNIGILNSDWYNCNLEFEDWLENGYELYFRVNYFSHDLFIIPQFLTKENYIVDFLFYIPSKNIKLVVECDGYDYHERTKEQATHDKRRDRILSQKGYIIQRFTGSEIYKNCPNLIKELELFLCRLVQE